MIIESYGSHSSGTSPETYSTYSCGSADGHGRGSPDQGGSGDGYSIYWADRILLNTEHV